MASGPSDPSSKQPVPVDTLPASVCHTPGLANNISAARPVDHPPITLFDDGVLYIYVQMAHLRHSPARPNEVGIPIHCLHPEAVHVPPSSSPVNPSHLETRPAPRRAAKTSRPRTVRNACISCRKAGKKCSESRPCERCAKRDIGHTCVDAPSARGKKAVGMPPTATADGAPGSLANQETYSLPPPVNTSIGGMAVAPSTPFDNPYIYPSTDQGMSWHPTHPFSGPKFSPAASDMALAGPSDDVSLYAHASSYAHMFPSAMWQSGVTEDWKEPLKNESDVDVAGPSGKEH
ncbi:hypothetical protein C8T65DRAFT_637714 [Cerioporus squamosus]|nr:hypothetical protein C8T65DRAFT_637714 [Cerioporus squamosus]